MIQVMIVDDEYLVRERLKMVVDWHDLGFEIAGEASDGEDALLQLQHTPIQLAIVDINMPIIDGLTFAKLAQQDYPQLKIIILTGYGSFEYAKSAMRAGVADYLLKPLNVEELTDVLHKIRQRIEGETEQKRQNDRVVMTLRASDDILRQKFIQSLLDGTGAEAAKDEAKLRVFCPRLIPDAPISVVVAGIDKHGADDGSPLPNWKRFAVLNIVQEILAQSAIKHVELSYDDNNRIIAIVNQNPVLQEDPRGIYAKAEQRRLEDACLAAVRAVHAHLRFSITAGIGNTRGHLSETQQSYREAVTALKHRTMLGGGRTIRYNELPKPTTLVQLSAIRQEALILLRLGSMPAIEDYIRNLFGLLRGQDRQIDFLFKALYEFIATLNLFAAEAKIELSPAVEESFSPEALTERLERLELIEQWLLDVYRNAVERTSSQKQSSPAKLVEKAKQYIDGHFADSELDLNEIAGSVFVNPSYLSRIFKNETGYSVVEYITACRMAKAKEMIDSGCRNMLFVAESIGFKDANYFSKCFKKYYRIAPSKFFADS
ncbi:response regulator [Paenibacillus contaminans]|uniref:DNA-binding response regulator n=1 Tax=Paenibacillus contaminans TaxID=450362 RepID=A0A329MHR8_9BACL|nr:response regulator [Paenibacillus contaminans]RAV19138.1 hypothetical protein DQG23_21605 [Paenibacillus contaminans]